MKAKVIVTSAVGAIQKVCKIIRGEGMPKKEYVSVQGKLFKEQNYGYVIFKQYLLTKHPT